MSRIDRWWTDAARGLARRTSRRGFLGRLGGVLAGGAALPLLPDSRAAAQAGARAPQPGEPAPETPEGDREACSYWRHCGMDGFIASCCGGSHNTCPPGTEMSMVTWVGTCRNPADGRDYIISYNDCCGKGPCGRCFCNRNEGDKPVYYPSRSNDINWCMGQVGVVYNSTTAVVLGVATEEG